jgi:heme-degrading monooxygenase HmoA
VSEPARTPEPPYYAVIFSSVLSHDVEGYVQTSDRMMALASGQPGFLGVESAREEIGITVSYWRDLDAINGWRRHAEHVEAKRIGRTRWYKTYRLRICRVEREYGAP